MKAKSKAGNGNGFGLREINAAASTRLTQWMDSFTRSRRPERRKKKSIFRLLNIRTYLAAMCFITNLFYQHCSVSSLRKTIAQQTGKFV